MSFEQILIFADEPLSWAAADALSTSWDNTCRLSRWRGGCGKNNPPPVAITHGWRHLMGCLDSLTQPKAALGTERGATPSTVPYIYLSTDAPALQQLTLETFPGSFRVLPGVARPSWESQLERADYLKAVADFEALRVCNAIVGVASSSYASMAAGYSLTLSKQVAPGHFCSLRRNRHERRGPDQSSWLRSFEACVLNPPK